MVGTRLIARKLLRHADQRDQDTSSRFVGRMLVSFVQAAWLLVVTIRA